MYTLIMVDDEIWTLRDMEVLLSSVDGFKLTGAYTNPLEAEKAIRENQPDVVLTDLKMEEMSGQALMKTIHEFCPHTRVIICSAYRDFDAARAAIKYNVVDYLLKPIVKADFLRAFETARGLLEKDYAERTVYVRRRVAASDKPWTEEYTEKIKKEAPCPCRIEPVHDACALIFYDNEERMDEWIQSLPEGLGFSREETGEGSDALQMKEALSALHAGFAYSSHKPLDRVQSFIVLHMGEKLTLNRIADEVGFSPAYLCDLFRKKCGIQLFSFIRHIRIETACHMLKTTAIPVRDISAMVGYDDNSHFSREFKSAKGVTPNAYRQIAEDRLPVKPES